MLNKVDEFWQDMRHGRRLLARNRSFTVIVSLTLALGIGATSAIFSVLYATVLAPLPVPDSNRLMLIQLVNKEGRRRGFSTYTVANWNSTSTTIARAAEEL